jgi:histidinol phosphatase-like enzyme (inositol monophosphatase family)
LYSEDVLHFSWNANRANAVAAARNPSLQAYVEFANLLADISGKAILPYFRRSLSIENKAGRSGFDPVTPADRAAERALRKAIKAKYPEHGIIGEEYAPVAGEGRYRWLLDPIDGTRAFIMGSPLWGTLIGLLDGSKPLLGLMDQPFTGERFWSDGRASHFRRGTGKSRRLKTRKCARLADATLTSTHPDLFSAAEAARFKAVAGRVRMTRFGGDCYGYCLLAAGFTDLVIEAGLKPHDIVPLIPIIEGAGGRVTTWDGGPAVQGGRILVAGDARVHEEALALLGGL